MYSYIIARSARSEEDFVSTSHAFFTNWTAVSDGVLFAAFQRMLAFPCIFSAQKSHCMRIRVCFERCRRVHFMRYLRHCLPVVMHQLQGTNTAEQSERKLSSVKEVREDLSNPAFLHRIRPEGHRYPENLANLLSSNLAEHYILT